MITTRSDEHGFDAVLAARFDEIDRICLAAQEFLDRQKLQRISFAILLGIREALTNAVRHGSCLDPVKEVCFSMVRQGDQVILTISDQGQGFNWRQASGACSIELGESGRGICILYRYFDAVEYNEAGNVLRLTKKVTSQGDSLLGV